MKLLLVSCLALFSLNGYSQNYIKTQRQATPVPSNQSLYKTEFELKHYAFSNGDSTILNAINFEFISSQREQSADVEVYDPSIDQTIILYSFDKIEAKYAEKFGEN